MRAGADGPRRAFVKGAVIREFLLWYEAQHGVAHHARIAARVAPEDAKLVAVGQPALGLLPSSLYPSTLLFPILDVVSDGLPAPLRAALAREANAHVVRKLSKGLYAAIFRAVASPGLYAKHIQRMWNVLHTTGKRRVVLRGGGVVDSFIEDWPGHHPFLCEIVTETLRAVFEAMGEKDVSIERVACVSTGAPACHAILRHAPR